MGSMVLCAALLAAPPGGVKGTIWEMTGVTVPGAIVVLLQGTKEIAQTRSDAKGGYELDDVPPGTYRVLATGPDGRSEDQGVNVAAGQTATVDIFLPVAGEEIDVTAAAPVAPPPSRQPQPKESLTKEDIASLPRSDSASVNEILATLPGVLPDTWGVIKSRATFGEVGVRVDGVPVPESLAGEVGELIPAAFLDEVTLGVGGFEADEGEHNAGQINLVVHRPGPQWEGKLLFSGGAYQLLSPAVMVGRSMGDFSVVAAASEKTSLRGLDVYSPDTLPHNRGHEERGLVRLEWQHDSDRISLLALIGREDDQVPNNPVSDGPTDAFGNQPSPYTPPGTDARFTRQELLTIASFKREATTALTASIAWRHASGAFTADAGRALGPGQASCSDSCATASDVSRDVDRLTGFFELDRAVSESHKLKLGAQIDQTFSRAGFAQYIRSDALDGPDPSQTLQGTQSSHSTGAALFAVDQMTFGRLRIDAGLRLEGFSASVDGVASPPATFNLGPRIGSSYAVSDDLVIHAAAGVYWTPPSVFEPLIALGAQGLATGSSPAFDLTPETMESGEIGIAWRPLTSLSIAATGWGRLVQNQLDDDEGGITSLLVPYQYSYRRGWGAGLDSQIVFRPIARLRLFANALLQHAVASQIVEGAFQFSADELSDTSWQILDHVQTATANIGAAFKDGATEASVLGSYGSGLRTGPANNETVPGHFRVDIGLSHHIDNVPGHPSLAIDVVNLFDTRYAIRLGNDQNPSHWGPARSVVARVGASF